jgi:hypothetical protein
LYFHLLDSCHLGNIIEYDTVTNLSWTVDVRTHAIAQVVDKVLSKPWAAAEELGREVPPLKRQDDCVVSFRDPKQKVELLADSRCCQIASNGTLEITAYDRQTFCSTCPYTGLPKTSLSHLRSETKKNYIYKKEFGDGKD